MTEREQAALQTAQAGDPHRVGAALPRLARRGCRGSGARRCRGWALGLRRGTLLGLLRLRGRRLLLGLLLRVAVAAGCGGCCCCGRCWRLLRAAGCGGCWPGAARPGAGGRRRSGSSSGVEVLRPGSARCGRGRRCSCDCHGCGPLGAAPPPAGAAAPGGMTRARVGVAAGRRPVLAGSTLVAAFGSPPVPGRVRAGTCVAASGPSPARVPPAGRRPGGSGVGQRAARRRRARPRLRGVGVHADARADDPQRRAPGSRRSAAASGFLRRQRSMTVHSGSGTVEGRRGSALRCGAAPPGRCRRGTAGGR